MLNFLYILGLINTILIIWFKTDAFVEYCSVLGIKIPTNVTTLTYPQFLYVTYKNEKTIRSFIIKIITCPYCLNFWLCIFIGTPFLTIFAVPLLYICTIFIYLLLERLSR